MDDRPSPDPPAAASPAEKDGPEGGPERGPEGGPKGGLLPPSVREYGGLILIALVLAILIKTLLIQAFYIPSGSMVPTLMRGDRVLVCRICLRFDDVDRGDIIVFSGTSPDGGPHRSIVGAGLHWFGQAIGVARPENDDFIKRVAALPGQTWEITHGKLYVEGKRVREPYLNSALPDTRSFGPETVPDGMLFVLGDNRLASGDSRFQRPEGTGYVPVDKVIGKAFVIVWPPSRMGGLG